MSKGKWQIGRIVITALLAIAAVAGWFFPVEAPEARVRERISIDAREDAYLWNGADLYVYSDDHSTQKFHVDGATGNLDAEGTLNVAGNLLSATGGITITDAVNITSTLDVDSTANVDGAVTFNSTLDVDGNISSGTGAITMTDSVLIDGAADAVQLLVSGYTTQTNSPFVVEETGGTDLFWVTNDGDVEMNGTTPLLTIGDAGGEDTAIVYDGAAQDYYAALDDGTDDFIIGLGSTVGTTPIISMDENQTVVLAADVRFTSQTAITITQSGSLVPTGTYQPIQAGGAVSFSTITAGTAGDLLVLINISANAITITDTGVIMLSGNLALSQYDTVTLWSDGTNWIQLATSNN